MSDSEKCVDQCVGPQAPKASMGEGVRVLRDARRDGQQQGAPHTQIRTQGSQGLSIHILWN